MGIGESSIYPSVETVLNRFRVLIQDAYQGGQGRVMTDINPSTIEFLNMALNRVQFALANEGVQSYWRDGLILTPLTPVANPNPGTQVYVGYNGYFNGETQVPSPALPNDLLIPWDIWERPTGSSQIFNKMAIAKVALPSRYQVATLREWQWSGDVIRMVGSTQSADLRLRYEAVIPEVPLLPPNTTIAQAQVIFNSQTIPIRMGAEALAQRMVYFFDTSRNDEGAAQSDLDAKAEADKLILMSVRGQQRTAVRRKRFNHGRNIDNAMVGYIQ